MNARHLLAGLISAACVLALLPASRMLAQPPEKKDEPADIKKLADARVDAAKKAYVLAAESVKRGLAGVKTEDVYRWSIRWLNAQRDASNKPEIHLSALNDHLKRMQEVSRVAAALTKAGQGLPIDGAAADFYLREAEFWLAQAKTPAKRAER